MRWICWVEIQGLYAAAVREAGLAEGGRPIAVLRGGRVFDGCREAFAAGLQLGSPARQVLRDVPRAALVEFADVDAAARARAFWDRCLAHTPYVEPVEPHQVLLDLPLPDGPDGSAGGRAQGRVSRRLQEEVRALAEAAASFGFAVFVGVGTSRLVARAAARALRAEFLERRPGTLPQRLEAVRLAGPRPAGSGQTGGRQAGVGQVGVCQAGVGQAGGRQAGDRQAGIGQAERPALQIAIVPPGEEARFLAPLPIGFLPCPPEVRRRLRQLGLARIGEAAQVSEDEWVRQLGPQGRMVARWSRGIDPEPVKPAWPPRRLARRSELGGVRDRDPLERELSRSAALLAAQLDRRGEGCQLVGLILELADGRVLHAERTLPRLRHTAYPIQQGLHTLLAQVLDGLGEPPEVAAVTAEVGLIGPVDWRQMELWDDRLRRERQERIEGALALLHERFPARVIGLGLRTPLSWREQMLQYADPYRWSRKA